MERTPDVIRWVLESLRRPPDICIVLHGSPGGGQASLGALGGHATGGNGDRAEGGAGGVKGGHAADGNGNLAEGGAGGVKGGHAADGNGNLAEGGAGGVKGSHAAGGNGNLAEGGAGGVKGGHAAGGNGDCAVGRDCGGGGARKGHQDAGDDAAALEGASGEAERATMQRADGEDKGVAADGGQEGRRGDTGRLTEAGLGQVLVPATEYYYNNCKYNPSLDLFLYGRPALESLDHIWQSKPLNLHDSNLLLASQHVSSVLGSIGEISLISGTADLSYEINEILKIHPGPIDCFRIDATTWKNDTQLTDWVQLLSSKHAADVTIINLAHKVDSKFPIEDLQSSSLQSLSIGFMDIAFELRCFNYSSLDKLHLLGCNYSGNKLSWVINECMSLSELYIAFSSENLRISSKSLENIQIWQCTGSWLTIQSAPRLRILSTGMTPKGQASVTIKPERVYPNVAISINDAPALQKINFLMLPHHRITINSTNILKESLSLTSVIQLRIGLDFSKHTQRYGLRKVLESLPMLSHLFIMRMDEVQRNEGLEVAIDRTFQDLDKVSCVTTCLRSFTIEDFRGGAAEVNVIQCFLMHAPLLTRFFTKRCPSYSRHNIKAAIREISSCKRASAGCVFTHT